MALRKKQFILYFGVLGWGLPTAVLFTVWNAYTKGALAPLEVILALIVFPLSGLGWGAMMWPWYKRQQEQRAAAGEE